MRGFPVKLNYTCTCTVTSVDETIVFLALKLYLKLQFKLLDVQLLHLNV